MGEGESLFEEMMKDNQARKNRSPGGPATGDIGQYGVDQPIGAYTWGQQNQLPPALPPSYGFKSPPPTDTFQYTGPFTGEHPVYDEMWRTGLMPNQNRKKGLSEIIGGISPRRRVIGGVTLAIVLVGGVGVAASNMPDRPNTPVEALGCGNPDNSVYTLKGSIEADVAAIVPLKGDKLGAATLGDGSLPKTSLQASQIAISLCPVEPPPPAGAETQPSQPPTRITETAEGYVVDRSLLAQAPEVFNLPCAKGAKESDCTQMWPSEPAEPVPASDKIDEAARVALNAFIRKGSDNETAFRAVVGAKRNSILFDYADKNCVDQSVTDAAVTQKLKDYAEDNGGGSDIPVTFKEGSNYVPIKAYYDQKFESYLKDTRVAVSVNEAEKSSQIQCVQNADGVNK